MPLCHSRTCAWARSRHVVGAFAAALGLTAAALAPAASAHAQPGCAHANTPIRAVSRAQLQASVICLINRQRTQRHLPRLRESQRLNRSAQGWTNVMVSHHLFSHGADFAARITAVGFAWSLAGENIATGYPTPASAVRAWMASPGHCRNILTPSFADAGTGVSARAATRFGRPGTWTQDFGLPMGQRAESANWGPANRCPSGS